MSSVLDPSIPIDVGALSQRQRIIEAMLESCAEKTYAATTIADIVSRASISRTTFYKRFAGKRECFDATLDWCIEQLAAVAKESHSSNDSPPEAVRKGAAATLDLLASKPAVAQLVMGEAVAVEPNVIQRYRQLLVPALENLWDAAGESRSSESNTQVSFGQAQVLIYNQVITGRTAQLPELLPELVYITLLPFAGHEEALKQARLAGSETGSGTR
ncbi:MAG TPA: TetR/AcrR family transcriptional regulator [Solirubrobacterales bacterium]|nr:TetR/AcrR family transcriptional regulator [Solirubrobacterales bacterium]